MCGNHASLQTRLLPSLCDFSWFLDQNVVVVGGHSRSADVEEDTPHEVVGQEEVGDPHDAWGDSGHAPLELRGDIHHNKVDMKDKGIAEEGRQYCVASVVDLAMPSLLCLYRVLSDETDDEAALNEGAAPLVRALTRVVVAKACW